MEIEYKLISYTAYTQLKVSHYILILHSGTKRILLSHPNLYLYSETRNSKNTSLRYAGVISKFYRYLSRVPRFKNIDVGSYHIHATSEDIVLWQAQRQIEKINKNSSSPSQETIELDADLLQGYFLWLNKTGYPTRVDVKLKTYKANFKDERLLSYISQKTKQVIDRSNIKVLNKKRDQKSAAGLITQEEIGTFVSQYTDPVYTAIFSLAIGTGMRPMDICHFPYLGNGKNHHIMPASMMEDTGQLIDFVIESKGHKTRTLKIHQKDLIAVESLYTNEHYQERTKRYEQKYGEPCPPSILFLTKAGDPVTPKKISDASTEAKKKAVKADKNFRKHITFYHTRHWWPTYYLIRLHGKNILTEHALVYLEAAEAAMIMQMGHGSRLVTYKYYIDQARILMMARQGWLQDLVKLHEEPVIDFISSIAKVDKKDKL